MSKQTKQLALTFGIGAIALFALFRLVSNHTVTPAPAEPLVQEEASPSAEKLPERNPQMPEPKTLSKPEMAIDQTKAYQAVLHTSEGDLTIQLNAKETPITVNNFVYLAKSDFYTNVVFHRIIKGFMVQTGDPTGTGMGSPGYKFSDEPFTGEYERGVVAMANSGPNTNGSQFFIMHADTPLPKNYVIFGKVIEGLDVLDKLATTPVEASATGEMSKPVNPPSINSVEIVEQELQS
jgi:cyclophilin family peptidyl-prolyl cis-trans isomerase